MKTRLAIVLWATLAVPVRALPDDRTAPATPVPQPDFNRIDYGRTQDYLALPGSLGNSDRIRKVAATLNADSPERTLSAIGRWIDAHLACDNRAAYRWRDFDGVIESKVYGGCADHALVFGALARARGIPTVWVKTMDADWIREFRTVGTCTSWRGHVFLEVHVGGRWRLLDATGLRLYDDYDPATRILPGDRYAYDKGGDPRALVLSTDWERWKEQTAAYFRDFDLTQLPVTGRRRLGAVYVAANSPVWQAIGRWLQEQGRSCYSFNTGYERFLSESRGGDLIITCVGDRPVLPESYHARYLPVTVAHLRLRIAEEPQGVVSKRLDDGTRVTLLYGKDVDSLLAVVAGFKLEPGR